MEPVYVGRARGYELALTDISSQERFPGLVTVTVSVAPELATVPAWNAFLARVARWNVDARPKGPPASPLEPLGALDISLRCADAEFLPLAVRVGGSGEEHKLRFTFDLPEEREGLTVVVDRCVVFPPRPRAIGRQ